MGYSIRSCIQCQSVSLRNGYRTFSFFPHLSFSSKIHINFLKLSHSWKPAAKCNSLLDRFGVLLYIQMHTCHTHISACSTQVAVSVPHSSFAIWCLSLFDSHSSESLGNHIVSQQQYGSTKLSVSLLLSLIFIAATSLEEDWKDAGISRVSHLIDGCNYYWNLALCFLIPTYPPLSPPIVSLVLISWLLFSSLSHAYSSIKTIPTHFLFHTMSQLLLRGTQVSSSLVPLISSQ